MDSISNIFVTYFDPTLSDVQCFLVLEIGFPMVNSRSSATQMKRVWNEAKENIFLKHLGARVFSEKQACFEVETQTDRIVNKGNAMLTEILLVNDRNKFLKHA